METLLKRLHKIPIDNEEKVDLLNQLAYEYHRMDLNKTKELAQNALEIGEKLNYLKGVAEAYSNIAMYHLMSAQYKELLEVCELGLEMASRIKNYLFICRFLNCKALYYQYLGQLDVAIEYFLKAVEFAEKGNDIYTKAYMINNIGALFSIQDQEKAKLYYLEAIECAEACNEIKLVGLVKSNLLMMYKEESSIVNFYELIQEIGSIALKTKNKRLEGFYFLRLAEYHRAKIEPLLAIQFYEKSIHIFEETGEDKQLGYVYESLANLYFDMKDYENTLLSLQKSEEFNNLYPDDRMEIRLYRFKANVYAAQSNFQMATQYYQKHLALSDKMRIEEKENQANELEQKYQAEKRHLENQLLKSQQSENEALIKSQQSRNELLEVQVEMEAKFNEELARSNRELERFAHVASHDIKAPIHTINSFSKLLKRSSEKLNEEELEYLNFINNSTQTLAELIDDLLEYSKVNAQRLKLSEVDLNQLLKELILNLRVQAKEKSVEISFFQEMPTVLADSIKLTRVFQNLISNAIKFSDPNKAASIEITYREVNHFHEFKVVDNGIGIKETKKDIFEPFTYLNSKYEYKGTGMGLALCKKIVEQHGGQISYKSEFGKGTVFVFNILK